MSAYIYEGFWISTHCVSRRLKTHANRAIDWSVGPFLGATLTVSSGNGLILAAFVAIFVGTLGGSAWVSRN